MEMLYVEPMFCGVLLYQAVEYTHGREKTEGEIRKRPGQEKNPEACLVQSVPLNYQ